MNNNHGQNPIQDSRLCAKVGLSSHPIFGVPKRPRVKVCCFQIRFVQEGDRGHAFKVGLFSSRDSSVGRAID